MNEVGAPDAWNQQHLRWPHRFGGGNLFSLVIRSALQRASAGDIAGTGRCAKLRAADVSSAGLVQALEELMSPGEDS